MKQLKISDGFYLNEQFVQKSETVVLPKQINHIFVVDVSYSMCNELPLIRKQLKNKLSSLMREGDTISIVWFSGNRDAGILKEEVEIKSLKTLSDINDAIDKWLKPVGATAFKKPLELTSEIIDRVKLNRPDSVFSLIFLTDGYNNDCPYSEALTVLNSIKDKLSSALFIEYGYYADSHKLTEMAGIVGGEKISCQDFDEFEPVFENKLSQNILGGKKIKVVLDYDVLHDFVYTVTDQGNILLYNVTTERGVSYVMVGEDINTIYWFSENGENNKSFVIPYDVLYGGVYILSDKVLNEYAELILGYLGDVHFIKKLTNSFGKQKLNEFKNSVKDAVTDMHKRFVDGVDNNYTVNENAYCLMNLIDDLSKMDDCLFYPNHEAFKYNRIGAKRVAVGNKITEKEKEELKNIDDINQLTERVEELKSTKIETEFVVDNKEKGYLLRDFVWNESRANLSVRVRYDGYVKLEENKFGVNSVDSFIYRTYTLVKDGIVNVEKLPVAWNPNLERLLRNNGVNYSVSDDKDALLSNGEYTHTLIIDIKSLPVINRKMVNSIYAKELATYEWMLLKSQASKKVYDYFRNQNFPKKSENFEMLVGSECAAWLKEIGITEYNGYTPITLAGESNDTYMSVNLETKIKGYSTLPKVVDVVDKVNKNAPLKPTEKLMERAVLDTALCLINVNDNPDVARNCLLDLIKREDNTRRFALQKIAEIKYSLILSKKWFKEFKSFDENKLTLDIEDNVVEFTFVLSEKEVKI